MAKFMRLMITSGNKDIIKWKVVELEFFEGEDGGGKRISRWNGPSVSTSSPMGKLLGLYALNGSPEPSISDARLLGDTYFLNKLDDWVPSLEEKGYVLVNSIGRRRFLLF